MKPNRQRTFAKCSATFAAGLLVFAASLTARAATVTWDGDQNDNKWSTNKNWGTGSSQTISGNDGLFYVTGAVSLTSNIVDTNISAVSVTFGNGQSGAVTVGGTNVLTLTGHTNYDPSSFNSGSSANLGTVGLYVQSGFGAVTINAPLKLGASQSWYNNSGNTLVIGGNVTGTTANSYGLTINGSGNTSFGGVISDPATSGATSLTKNGSGILTLSNANTYTGATTISAGTLVLTGSLSSSTALALTGGTFKLGSPTLTQTVSSLSLSGGSTIVVQLQNTGSSIGKINDTGAFTGSGQTLEVDLVGGTSNFTVGQSFIIFTGTKPGTGTFSTFNLPAGFVWDTSHLQGTGGTIDGSIRVAAIPEPGPLLLGLAGLLPVGLMWMRRSRSRQHAGLSSCEYCCCGMRNE